MGLGYLTIETRTNFETLPVADAQVKIKNQNGETLFELTTDRSGKTRQIALETIDRQYTFDAAFPGHPYASYNAEIEAAGYETIKLNGIHIFDGEEAVQLVTMIPMLANETTPTVFTIEIGGEHAVEMTEEREQEGITPMATTRVLRHVIIPDFITVHLGRPDSAAQNVRVPFIEYIANVASHEIFPTWPENSLRANIHAMVTFALNRIFTEWYRSRGYPFDITSSTAFDQYFVYNGTIFQSVAKIAAEVFNQYVRRTGQYAPFFTLFCAGQTGTCQHGGMSQWATVTLANQGFTPIQILRRFYPPNIEIAESNIFTGITESYPGAPLRIGDRGLNVQIMQRYLNRIRRNYPLIPVIASENGVFGEDMAAAVRTFQSVFNLPSTGVIDRATWFRISYIYVAVARLAELDSEGSTLGIGTVPPSAVLRQGSRGHDVITLQYILDVISQFYPVIPNVIVDGIFGGNTALSVTAYQRMMNLPADGIVGPNTWNALYNTYWGIQNNRPPVLPPPPPGNFFNHTVVAGDTLWILAQRFGTTVQAIMQASGIASDRLTIGQVLRIPASGGSGGGGGGGGGGGTGGPEPPPTEPPPTEPPPTEPPPVIDPEEPEDPEEEELPRIPGGTDQYTPPVSTASGNSLVPTEDGMFIEIDENGVPLGEWYWDDDEQIWIFDEFPPLSDAPQTGSIGMSAELRTLLMCLYVLIFMGCLEYLLFLSRKIRFDIGKRKA
jgi:peptidoglycan hydrolase-like protein with peptidoglycan-binding domain